MKSEVSVTMKNFGSGKIEKIESVSNIASAMYVRDEDIAKGNADRLRISPDTVPKGGSREDASYSNGASTHIL